MSAQGWQGSHDEDRYVLSTGEVVRQARGDELNAVLELGRLIWRDTYAPIAGEDYVAMGLAKWWTPDAIIPAMRLGRVLVVAESDEPGSDLLGVASWGVQDGDAVLWRCYVHPGAHRRGVGRALVHAAAHQAQERGYSRMTLSHLLANTQARRFYEALGFVELYRENEDSPLPASVWCGLDLSEWEPQAW